MIVSVRINGSLAQEIGTTRLRVSVEPPATVRDVLDSIGAQYPHAAETLSRALPFVAGRHLDRSAAVEQGQEVALLMPVAGG